MTRTSKQEERRHKSPRRPKIGRTKTGPKKDALKAGYKEHSNATTTVAQVFIGKVK
jgi:hypothetical protein